MSAQKVIGKKKRVTAKQVKGWSITVLFLLIGCLQFFPLYMVYINSFKNLFQFVKDPLALPDPWTLQNYEYAFQSFNYLRLLLNNLIFEGASLFFIVLLGAMAGFTIARRPSKLKKAIYAFIVFGITLPTYTALYPQIALLNKLGLTDRYTGVILLYVTGGLPMSVFLFNGHFSGASRELEDAARSTAVRITECFSASFFRFRSRPARRSCSCRRSAYGTIPRTRRSS